MRIVKEWTAAAVAAVADDEVIKRRISFFFRSIKCEEQCDQMALLFFNICHLPQWKFAQRQTKFVKGGSKVCQIVNKLLKYCQNLLRFCQSG